jgi:hypothetical protein
MHISGKCDFCERDFREEGLLMSDRGEAKKDVLERPFGYAVTFPWNRRRLPQGCNFSPESLKNHRITTRTACSHCMRKPLVLVEIDRDVFGNDEDAINRHSIRVYEVKGRSLILGRNTRFQLDRTLDVDRPYFQLYGPYDAKFRGVLPTILINDCQYWGDTWSWRKAEEAMCRALNATIKRVASVT